MNALKTTLFFLSMIASLQSHAADHRAVQVMTASLYASQSNVDTNKIILNYCEGQDCEAIGFEQGMTLADWKKAQQVCTTVAEYGPVYQSLMQSAIVGSAALLSGGMAAVLVGSAVFTVDVIGDVEQLHNSSSVLVGLVKEGKGHMQFKVRDFNKLIDGLNLCMKHYKNWTTFSAGMQDHYLTKGQAYTLMP